MFEVIELNAPLFFFFFNEFRNKSFHIDTIICASSYYLIIRHNISIKSSDIKIVSNGLKFVIEKLCCAIKFFVTTKSAGFVNL